VSVVLPEEIDEPDAEFPNPIPTPYATLLHLIVHLLLDLVLNINNNLDGQEQLQQLGVWLQ
jgi:hypothetical protein